MFFSLKFGVPLGFWHCRPVGTAETRAICNEYHHPCSSPNGAAGNSQGRKPLE